MNGKPDEMYRLTAFVLLELALLILVCDVNAKGVHLGSGGERVAAIQRKMKQNGAYDGKTDGICGFETTRCFEKHFKIKPSSAALDKAIKESHTRK